MWNTPILAAPDTHIAKCLEGSDIAPKNAAAMWESLYVPLPLPVAGGGPLEGRYLEILGVS
jgi:hypothetical protein